MSPRVAILGATGLVGRTMLQLLEERDFPVASLKLLASRGGERSLPFRGEDVRVEAVTAASFRDVDLALFAVKNPISLEWAPRAMEAGARVVDNSSAYRYDDDVPLVVPEINGDLLLERPPLIANPNCSTIAIVMALAPLTHLARLSRVTTATYQSVSGAGSEAIARLESGVRASLDGPAPRAEGAADLAFNVVPHIDRFESNGYTREEMKIVWETRKILRLPDLPVVATAVRVPVRVGHSAAVHVKLDREVALDDVRARWRSSPGVEVVDDPTTARYPMPLDVAGKDAVLVGRLRRDLAEPDTLVFFVVSDNLRKGAALNAVQIAEAMGRVPARAS